VNDLLDVAIYTTDNQPGDVAVFISFVSGITYNYTDEQSQDAVGSILANTADIELAYDDETPDITASLTTAVTDDLALANSSLQPSDIGSTVQAYSSVLQNTTASYTIAESSKLGGIQSGAEVNPEVVSQAEAEAGIATNERIWTAERVKQAIQALDTDEPTDLAWDAASSEVRSSTGADTAITPVDGTNPGLMLPAQFTKLGFITVTQAVDLDQLEADVAALANGMVLKGDWDASIGTFPSGANTGYLYYVNGAGTVDSIEFNIGDSIAASTDGASTTVYAGNWIKFDSTDAVTSVAGRVGNVIIVKSDIGDLNAYEVSGTDVAVADGGTGASTASGARTNLGVDPAGTDNSTAVTLAGSLDYLAISGQEITLNQVDLASDVIGNLPDGNIASAAIWNGKADKSNVLELDNISSFTPDTDYEPATKKYVDDSHIYTVRTVSGTADTLVIGDSDNIVRYTNAADITVTVPTGLGDSFSCLLLQDGAGQVIWSESGTTIECANSHTRTGGQYTGVTLVAISSNTFRAIGQTGA